MKRFYQIFEQAMASFLTMSYTLSGSVESITNNSKSKDQIRISKSFGPVQKHLQENNITKIMPFFDALKEHSKIKKAPKGFQCQKLINKFDAYELVRYLISISNCTLDIKMREFNRASYQYRNVLLTYFALEYPGLMQTVALNGFQGFPFSSHLFEVDTLIQKWVQYVQEIQENKNQNASYQVNEVNIKELSINEEFTDVSMAPDFVSIDMDNMSFDNDDENFFSEEYFSSI